MQAPKGLLPLVAVFQVVPVRDDIPKWAAGLAEGNAAVHAAGGLVFQLLFRQMQFVLFPVLQALADRAARGEFTFKFLESSGFTHSFSYFPTVSAAAFWLCRAFL